MSLWSWAQTWLGLFGLHLFIFCTHIQFASLGSLLAWVIIMLLSRWANSWWCGARRGLLQWLPVICQASGQSRREQRPVCLQATWKINVLVVFLFLCLSLGWKGDCQSSSLQTHSRQVPTLEAYLLIVTPGNSEKGPSLSVSTASKITDRATFQTHRPNLGPYYVNILSCLFSR